MHHICYLYQEKTKYIFKMFTKLTINAWKAILVEVPMAVQIWKYKYAFKQNNHK